MQERWEREGWGAPQSTSSGSGLLKPLFWAQPMLLPSIPTPNTHTILPWKTVNWQQQASW